MQEQVAEIGAMQIEYELTEDAAKTASAELTRRYRLVYVELALCIVTGLIETQVRDYLAHHVYAAWALVIGLLAYFFYRYPSAPEQERRAVTDLPGQFGKHRIRICRAYMEHATLVFVRRVAWAEVIGVHRLPSAIAVETALATDYIPLKSFESIATADQFIAAMRRYRWGDPDPTAQKGWARSSGSQPSEGTTALPEDAVPGPTLVVVDKVGLNLDIKWDDINRCFWYPRYLTRHRPLDVLGVSVILGGLLGYSTNFQTGAGLMVISAAVLICSEYRYRRQRFDAMTQVERPKRFETDFKRFVYASSAEVINSEISALADVARSRAGRHVPVPGAELGDHPSCPLVQERQRKQGVLRPATFRLEADTTDRAALAASLICWRIENTSTV